MSYELTFILVEPDLHFSRVISVFDMGKVFPEIGEPRGGVPFKCPCWLPGSETKLSEEDGYGDPVLEYTLEAMKEWLLGLDTSLLNGASLINRKSMLAAIEGLETLRGAPRMVFLKYGH